MVKRYQKGADVQLSKHFHLREFDCRCTFPECTVTYVDSDLVSALEELRYLGGDEPIYLNSGFRCTRWNERWGGKAGSQHLQGKAANVRKENYVGSDIAILAKKVPLFRRGGVGTYKAFVHVDVRGYRSRWSG